METTTIELPVSLLEAITARARSKGLSVDQFLMQSYGGEHTEVTSVDELVALASAERERTFSLHGRKLKVRMRALSADESAEVDKVQAGIIPPKDPKTGIPNEDDPDYLARVRKARRIQRATIFDLCVLSFKLKGDTLPDRADFLYKSLPPGIIEGVWRAVLELTSDPIENALFT